MRLVGDVTDVCPTPLGQWTRPVFAPAGRNQHSMQQGRQVATMRAVASITVATNHGHQRWNWVTFCDPATQ